MNFSDRVKLIRNENNLSQSEIAEQLGMTRDAYANFEYDRIKNQNAKNPTIKAICEKYHISELWLRTGEGEMHPARTREFEIGEMTATMFMADDADKRYQLYRLFNQLDDDQLETFFAAAKKWVEAVNEAENKEN